MLKIGLVTLDFPILSSRVLLMMDKLPYGLRLRIRRLMDLNPEFVGEMFNRMIAKKLASTLKRLDLCSAQIADALHLSGLSGELPVRGKICVEIGSGWILSHAVVFYLLGAKRVIATDIQRPACLSALYQSIHGSNLYNILDVLSPFEEQSTIRTRLNELLAIKTFSFDVLEENGIEYVAPIDLAQRSLNTRIDFVYSMAVLEHVPISDVLPLLENLARDLSDEGKMIHCVHLVDHKDPENAPYDFLSEPEEKFTRDAQISRGNRIRRSQWRDILSQVKNMDFKFIREWSGEKEKLPTVIDPSIHYVDDEDLAIRGIWILGTKKRA